MSFFKPAWMSKNETKALRAIEKMTDEKELAQAAKEADSWQVSKAAVDKMNDPQMLADIVKHAQNRWKIMLTEERDKALDMVATAYSHAAKGLPFELPIINESYDVRYDAIGKIVDQEALSTIVLDKRVVLKIRLAAAEQLEDQALSQEAYADAARAGWGAGVKFFEKITRQDLIINLARKARDVLVRMYFAEKAEDESIAQEVYTDIALHASRLNRLQAIRKLMDKAFLQELAKNSPDEYIRDTAAERLTTLE